MFVPDPTPWKISMPAAPEGAKGTPAPPIGDRLHSRQDRIGFTDEGFTHLFLVTADGGTPRQLTRGKWNVGARSELSGNVGFDFTPDGRTIILDGLKDADGDDRYQDAQLYSLDVASGALRQLTTRPGYHANPQVSPDGKLVAFAGYDSTPHTHTTADLWVMGTDGSGVRNLTRDFDRDPNELHWAPDGSGVYFASGDRGAINVYFAALRGGATPVTTGAQVLSVSSVARDLTAVGLRSGPNPPPDVVRYHLRRPGAPVRLTAVNDDVLAGKRLAKVEEVWYTSSGGARVQAWVVKPPGFDPTKKYPLILEIHGGPFAMYNVGFSYMFQNFAANGYVVLFVNPRGSTGYGSAFSNGIDHNYPGPDYDDLMAGADTLIGRGYVDTRRMYVSGGSGGGGMSRWGVGHTARFRPAAGRLHGTGSKPSNFIRTQLYMMSWFQKYGGTAAPAVTSAVPTRLPGVP